MEDKGTHQTLKETQQPPRTRSQQEGKQGSLHQQKTQTQKLTLKKKEKELSKGKR